MRRVALAVAAVMMFGAPLVAQRPAADDLRQARALYDRLELERAGRMLKALVLPARDPAPSPAELVDAYKLLGATLVLMGQVDSGVVAFKAALERDPFVDLEPEEYTPAQVGAFAQARRQVFAIAARAPAAMRVDPRTERLRFAFATTHDAGIRAELRLGDSTVTVFEQVSAGFSEIVWNGLTATGRLAPPGRYELRIYGASRVLEQTGLVSSYFDLRHETEAFEDTLPPIAPAQLLPERTPATSGLRELGKGAAVAGGVMLIGGALSQSELGNDNARPAIVAAAGLVAGVVAYVASHKRRDIPENIAANRNRLEAVRVANDSIRAHNEAKVARTILVVSPAAGVGR